MRFITEGVSAVGHRLQRALACWALTEWITLELSCLEPFLGHQELGARFCKVFYTLYSALAFTDYVSLQQGSVTPHAPFQYFHLICDLISS